MTVKIEDGWVSGTLPDDTGKEWPVKQFRQPAARGDLKVEVPNLVLHTTETDGYIETLKYPSQWQTGEGIIGQHIKLGLAGDSVWTYDTILQQIEMVGRSKLGLWLPGEPTLGPTVALVAWLHKKGLIRTGVSRPARLKDLPLVLDKGPQAVKSYYRRMVPDEPGVYGHVDIKDNTHWDPGSFDYDTFLSRVMTAINLEEDDRMFTEWYAGFRAHEAGEPEPADGFAKKGWNDRKRLLADASKPHSHEGAAHFTVTVT